MSYVLDRNKTINTNQNKKAVQGSFKVINKNFKSIGITLGNIPVAQESNYNSTLSCLMKHLRG